MMKMKHNKEFRLKVKAGTNATMTKDEFLQEIYDSLGAGEARMNACSKIRFHFELLEVDAREDRGVS